MAKATKKARKAARKTRPQQLVEKHTELKDLIEKAARHASVLFADMGGSTAFKKDREALDALEKPYQHHLTICAIVKQKPYAGKVIKSMGDGVMVMFDGEACEQRAVDAGLAILREFRKKNTARRNKDKDKNGDADILTRIGIHSGPVWTFRFPESPMEDPQGTTVDVAARLCSLADDEQLLCTEQETFQAAGGELVFKNAGRASRRFLKGLTDRLCIRMALPVGDEWHPSHVPLSGHRRPIRPQLKKQLDKACTLFLKGDAESLARAYEAFALIVEDDPQSFEGRFGLSSVLLSSDATRLRIAEECEALRDHLAAATQSHPKYYRVWLLVGLARLRHFELHGGDLGDLDKAIEHTETAVALASLDLDVPGILEGKMQLAHLLLTRAKEAGPDGGTSDLATAAKLCWEAKPIHDGHRERADLEYTLIDCRIRVAQAVEASQLEDVEGRLLATLDNAKGNPDVHSALAELYTKRKTLASGNTA